MKLGGINISTFSFNEAIPPLRAGGSVNELSISAVGSKSYYATLFLVLVTILVPVWIVDYPGMVDYPNHLTRCYILAHYKDNPLWQQRYYLDLTPLPNLAIDLIVVPLIHFLPLLVCGKIFVSMAAALYVFGCSAVGRAVSGRPNWLALVCAFTFYNGGLLYGFLNYILGLGIFLCAFAFWFRVRNKMTPFRFLVCCLLSVIAFLAHLSAIMFLGVACLTVALIEVVRERELFRFFGKVAWLVSPVILMALYMKGSGKGGRIMWGGGRAKLIHLITPLTSYNLKLELGVAILLLVCGLTLIRRSKVHITFFVGIAYLLLYVITPSDVLTANHVDERYIVPSLLFLILSIEPLRG